MAAAAGAFPSLSLCLYCTELRLMFCPSFIFSHLRMAVKAHTWNLRCCLCYLLLFWELRWNILSKVWDLVSNCDGDLNRKKKKKELIFFDWMWSNFLISFYKTMFLQSPPPHTHTQHTCCFPKPHKSEFNVVAMSRFKGMIANLFTSGRAASGRAASGEVNTAITPVCLH